MSITATYAVSATTLSKTVNDSGLVVAQDDLPKQEELHAKEDTISSNTTPKQHQKRKPVEPLRIDTTTSTSNKRKSSGLFSATSSILSPSTKHVLDLGELDPEEQDALREEIRARKLARKQKKTYADDADDSEDETRINIGTRVSEGHRNYQMMYDMLTGIRIAVGRVCSKMKRELTPEDFLAAHKLVFDVTGNELTPGVKYDFKFKDYAPWVFRNLREKFHIDAADYMMSLTNKYILSEIGSPGKSGSFFYYSRDYRFIIKTIHHSEHKFMRKILKNYYEHVCSNPNTLLCRFYGLHRIKLPRGRKIHFVVMGNVLPSNKDIHQTFDLKGSMFGRITSDEEVKKNPHAVMKDQNWVKNKQQLQLGPAKRDILITQLERDVELLQSLNIMDYSLLIGIHDIIKGNTECIRDHRLHMVTPKTARFEKQATFKRNKPDRAEIVRKALRNANPEHIDPSELPVSPSEERRWCIFYHEDGGFRSSNEHDKSSDKLYYLGIIDILTPYNYVKKTEHIWKSLTQDKTTISSVNPALYGKRFIHFMKKAANGSFKTLDEKKNI